MNCCQCQGIETVFDQKEAAQRLKRYRRKGPEKTTGLLINALKAEGVAGLTLLDIGGGIGVIQHELLSAGASSATNVDASPAYVDAAREEAARQGHAGQVHYYQGNFVDLAPDIPAADIVTLDRVICCYPDMPGLVGLSSARAAKLYGLVYPRDTWWMRIALSLTNFTFWLRRSPFRLFLHPTEAVEAVVQSSGLQRRFYRHSGVWQIAIYGRS